MFPLNRKMERCFRPCCPMPVCSQVRFPHHPLLWSALRLYPAHSLPLLGQPVPWSLPQKASLSLLPSPSLFLSLSQLLLLSLLLPYAPLSLWAQSPSLWRPLPSPARFPSHLRNLPDCPPLSQIQPGHHDGKWQLPAQRPLPSYPHPYLTFLPCPPASGCPYPGPQNPFAASHQNQIRCSFPVPLPLYRQHCLSLYLFPEHRPSARLLYQPYCGLHCRPNQGTRPQAVMSPPGFRRCFHCCFRCFRWYLGRCFHCFRCFRCHPRFPPAELTPRCRRHRFQPMSQIRRLLSPPGLALI